MRIKTLRSVFLPVILVLPIMGCNNHDVEQRTSAAPSESYISIPLTIRQAALPSTGTLAVRLFMDGNATPIGENTNVDINAASIGLEVTVNPGVHNFTIVFYYTHPVFGGPWELASGTRPLNVVEGTSNSLDFTSGDYFFQDFDKDGFTNLAELDASMNTDPGDARCVFNKSIIGSVGTAGCKLG